VVKALVGLGLSEMEAKVYVYLAKEGPQKARNIAEALKMVEQQLHLSLKNLRDRNVVNATAKRPAEFSAIPFDKALDLLMKAHLREARNMERDRDEILSQWHSMITGGTSAR
jgi:sugar-specific transcriptional regulator TrmB